MNARKQPSPDALLLSMEEAAAALGLGRSTIYELTRRGDIASVRIGRARRIPRRALEDYVTNLTHPVA